MDDHAVVAGIGYMDDYKIAWIGQQKEEHKRKSIPKFWYDASRGIPQSNAYHETS